MMRASDLRPWTALLVGACCAATMLCALSVLRLGFIDATKSGADAAIAFGEMVNDPIVGEPAREARLRNAAMDAQQRVAELTSILALRPLSSAHWLDLARARYAAGAAPDKFFGALAMSQLTGPNEATAMAARGIFGLSLWALAPAAQRTALTRDIVGGWPQVSEARRMLLRMMLESALPQTRRELGAALAAHGHDGAAIATRLGVESGGVE